MTIGKFTENCTNLGSLIANHKDNLTVKRVSLNHLFRYDKSWHQQYSWLSSKFNTKHDLNNLYRDSIFRIVYEESDRCQKFDDRVIVIVGLLIMKVNDNT